MTGCCKIVQPDTRNSTKVQEFKTQRLSHAQKWVDFQPFLGAGAALQHRNNFDTPPTGVGPNAAFISFPASGHPFSSPCGSRSGFGLMGNPPVRCQSYSSDKDKDSFLSPQNS
jgi:hypothetical protein